MPSRGSNDEAANPALPRGNKSSRGHSRQPSGASPSALLAGTNRHVACNACRERKVRCDGNQPSCCSCNKRGQNCVYSIPKGGDASMDETLRIIESLTSSLARAEAEIAEHKAKRGDSISSSFQPSTVNSSSSSPDGSTGSSRGTSVAPDSFGFSCQSVSPSGANSNLQTMPPDDRRASLDYSPADPTFIDSVTHLHNAYFLEFDCSFPLLNRTSFLQKCRERPIQECMRSLVYAICMHGALSLGCSDEEGKYYRLCRRQLEVVECNSNGRDLPQLATAQASLLMTLYEFRRMYLSRANISAARAIRYAQMLRLYQLDSPMSQQPSGGELDVQSCIDTEERRRLFWGAFMVDRLKDGTITFDETQIFTHLPQWNSVDMDSEWKTISSGGSPRLSEVLSGTPTQQLCPFAACVVSSVFWSRCSPLVQEARRVSHSAEMASVTPADFWQRCYELDVVISNFTNGTCKPLSNQFPGDPNVMLLHFMIHSTVITLHRAAVVYACAAGQPEMVLDESHARCCNATTESAMLVRWLLSHPDTLSKMSFFSLRCLYTVAKELAFTIRSLDGDGRLFDFLRDVSSAVAAMRRRSPLAELYLEQITGDRLGTNDLPESSFLPL